jgi:hypothetical protein
VSDKVVGFRPICAYVTWTFKDTKGAQLGRGSATFPVGLLFRVWFPTKHDADLVLKELSGLFSTMGSALRDRWFDVGTTDLVTLHLAVLALAKHHGLTVLTDAQVCEFARSQVATEKPN